MKKSILSLIAMAGSAFSVAAPHEMEHPIAQDYYGEQRARRARELEAERAAKHARLQEVKQRRREVKAR